MKNQASQPTGSEPTSNSTTASTTKKEENRRAWGEAQEEIALKYLLKKGYRLVKRNFHFGKSGEVDLVMRDGPIWVFVEVKARRNHSFGLPEESVNARKREQIRKIARGFLYINGVEEYEARFDVVAVDYVTGTGRKPEIRHLENAFV